MLKRCFLPNKKILLEEQHTKGEKCSQDSSSPVIFTFLNLRWSMLLGSRTCLNFFTTDKQHAQEHTPLKPILLELTSKNRLSEVRNVEDSAQRVTIPSLGKKKKLCKFRCKKALKSHENSTVSSY